MPENVHPFRLPPRPNLRDAAMLFLAGALALGIVQALALLSFDLLLSLAGG